MEHSLEGTILNAQVFTFACPHLLAFVARPPSYSPWERPRPGCLPALSPATYTTHLPVPARSGRLFNLRHQYCSDPKTINNDNKPVIPACECQYEILIKTSQAKHTMTLKGRSAMS